MINRQQAILRDLGRAANLMQKGQFMAAEPLLLDLQARAPMDAAVLFHLAMVLYHTERAAEGIATMRRALAVQPRFLPALINLGNFLLAVGNPQEALRCASNAAEIEPRNPDILRNLAMVLAANGRPSEALTILDRALAIRPTDIPLRLQKLQLFKKSSQWEPAYALLTQTLQFPAARGNALLLAEAIQISAITSHWGTTKEYEEALTERLREPTRGVNPIALAMAFDHPGILSSAARSGRMACAPRPGRSGTRDRVTIGYLSPDLRDHPVTQMLLSVIPHHDRSRFRIIAFATKPHDQSPAARSLLEQFDEYIDLSSRSDYERFHAIKNAQTDVLVDLAGITRDGNTTLLANRPCPAQILWLGCATTTGMDHYDAYILDKIVAPDGYEEHCSEPLIRMDCCFHPISPGFRPNEPSSVSRQSLGLPQGSLLVGMLQQPDRLRSPHIDRVVSILLKHPETHLWLRANADAQDRVRSQLASMGLPPSRVHFFPRFENRSDYLAALSLVDMMVDTHPYGGHSTTGEALSLGIPVIALAGSCIHSRVSLSMMTELALADLCAMSPGEQLRNLDRILGDPDALHQWKIRFREAAQQPAAERDKRLTRALENAYVSVLTEAPIQSK